MATVVYALCGTGRGHSSRAAAVASVLRARGHRVVFAAGDPNAADLPGETFGVPALRQVVRGNRVRLGATARANARTARHALDTIEAAARWLRLVGADVVVADHEPFVGRAAQRLGTPVVALSRQLILVEALHETALGEAASAWATARGVALLAPPRPAAVVVPALAPPVRRPGSRARFVPPILRDDVLAAPPRTGERVLVYVNETDGMEATLATLGRVDAPFDVFGFAPSTPVPDNVWLHATGRAAFLERLTASRAVVATAGFTLLSEALHLGKPVLALPNHGFFEQVVNARAVVRMGRGEAVWDRTLRASELSGFLGRTSAYACPPTSAADGRTGREAAADAIEAVLREPPTSSPSSRICGNAGRLS